MSAGLLPIGNAYDQESMCQAICTATGSRGLSHKSSALCAEYLYGIAPSRESTHQAICLAAGERGMTYESIALCVEYLCGTIFSSLAAFTHYMRFNDQLQIPGGQTLVVKDIRLLTHNFFEAPIPVHSEIDENLSILRRAVAPLGRSCRLVSPTNSTLMIDDFTCTATDDFALTPKSNVAVMLTTTPIHMRLSDLYRMMLASSIRTTTFVRGQEIHIWGQSHAEYDQLCQNFRLDTIYALFRRIGLVGAIPSMSGSGLQFKPVTWGNARGLQATADVMTVSLEEHYVFNARAFRQRMALIGEINVPPNQPLIIEDNVLAELFGMYHDLLENQLDPSFFVLDQMILTLGKRIRCSPPVQWSFNGKRLEMIHPKGFRVDMVFEQITMSWGRLGEMMLEDDLGSLKFQPNQQVLILNVPPDEDLALFLHKRNPVFYTWSISSSSIERGMVGKTNCVLFSSDSGVTFNLEPASTEEFMFGVLRRTSLSTIQAVKEMDADGLILILFQALFYCTHTSVDTSPYFVLFSPSTQAKLRILRDQTPEFKKAFLSIMQDAQLKAQMLAILNGDPEKFKNLELDKLPPAIGILVKKIKELTFEELQKKEFFIHLQKTIQDMNKVGL
jgi:hypothetical protein